jgi:phosphate transport system substrate-binding protein
MAVWGAVTIPDDSSRTSNRSYRVNARPLLSLATAGLVGALACTSKSDSPAGDSAKANAQNLLGAGATFSYPLFSRWAADYLGKSGAQVNYQSKGSGAGIRQLMEMTIDFGGSDAPMTDDEMSKAKGGPILHIPIAMGAVVLAYNLPALTGELRVSPAVIADIYLGKITKWNDRQIAAQNPGKTLPGDDIVVVHRSDGSGTTFIWSQYLSAVSPEWAKRAGTGKELKWPVGLGASGNEGVAGQVKQLPGAVGYVELAYARQNKLPYATVQNAAGNYIVPTIESVTAAAASVAQGLPETSDFRISIINAPGADAYPISSLTWALIYQNQTDKAKGQQLVDFLRFGLTEGQASAAALDYAPLPAAMITQLQKRLDTVK